MSQVKAKISLYFFAVSLLVLLYYIFIVNPYAERYNFYSGISLPDQNRILQYFFMNTPVLIGYVIFLLKFFNKILFLKSIIYPLIIINIYFGFFICLLIFGGNILWLMVATILIPLIMLPISFIVGLIKDIKYLKKKLHA